MANARVIDAADAAVALIAAAWNPVAPSGVRRAYPNQRIDLTAESAAELLQGRQVYVFPGSPVTSRPMTRGDLWRTYVLRVLVVERFADAGDPPADWIDERTAFVEQVVFDVLSNPDLKLVGQLTPDPEQDASIDEVVAADLLRDLKVFWSYASVPYVEPTDHSGSHP